MKDSAEKLLRAAVEEDDYGWFRVTWEDYVGLVEKFDWGGFFARFDRPIKLLDVGCGKGRFPRVLLASGQVARLGHPVRYDLLDPSSRQLRIAARGLRAPFVTGSRLQTTLQDLSWPGASWDLVWAVNSLYSLPRGRLGELTQKMARLLAAGGRGLIYLPAAESFQNVHYRLFLEDHGRDPDRQGYVTAEEITAALTEGGIPWRVLFEHRHFSRVDRGDRELLAEYLSDNCLIYFRPLEHWMRCRRIWSLVQSCLDGPQYRFPQLSWLIELSS